MTTNEHRFNSRSTAEEVARDLKLIDKVGFQKKKKKKRKMENSVDSTFVSVRCLFQSDLFGYLQSLSNLNTL
jgi:hypothetical protein